MSPGFKFLSNDQNNFQDSKYSNNENYIGKVSDNKKEDVNKNNLDNQIIE
jgi:hypothetical protein